MEKLIQRYFEIGIEPVDFNNNYFILDRRFVLKILSKDNSHGFVFLTQNGTKRELKHRMEAERDSYREDGMVTSREFCDYEDRRAGFSWRLDNGEL